MGRVHPNIKEASYLFNTLLCNHTARKGILPVKNGRMVEVGTG